MKVKSKIALLLAIAATALLGQNPNVASFPTTVATDQELAVAKRVSSSTLSGSINSSTLTVTVGSGTQFLQYEIITIDSEEMLICSIASNTLTICTGTRGYNGTTAASHTAGVAVRGTITSWHVNQINAEMKSVQTVLRDRIAICPSTTGSTNAYACSPAPSIAAYGNGKVINFKANASNTGAATLNLNGLGTRTIKKLQGAITTDLAADDIRANQWVTVMDDGTNFQMLSQLGNAGTSLGSLTGCIGATSGTPSARTITAGSGVSVANGNCSANPTISADTAVMESRATQQAGTTTSCAASNGTDAYTCTMTPTLTSYNDRMVIEFEATVTANTGAATLAIDGLSGGVGVAIKKCDGTTDPSNGDIAIGRQITLRHDGTVFRLPCNPSTIAAGAGDADAATVQSDGYKRCNAANASTTYTCTMTPALTAYGDGMVVLFRQTGNSSPSGTSTLNIDGLGAKSIKWTNLVLADTAIGAAGGNCVPWQNQDYRLMYNSGADAFVMQDCVSFGAGNNGTAALRTELPLNTHTTCSLGGSAPNYTCTMSSVSGAGLSQGTSIYLYSTSAVTSAFTVNVNSNGALNVRQPDGTSDPSASCPVPALTPVPVVLNADGTDTWRMVACAAATSGASESTRCTVTATGDTITMFTGATSGDPCNVNFGSTIQPISSSKTFVLDGSSTGADTVRVQVLPAGTVSVLIAAGATGTCTGCTASVGTAFATDAVPIWEWTVTDDAFDVGGGTRRKADAGTKNVACGTGMSCSESGGTTTVSATSSGTGSDFATDMTYASWHWLPYGGQPVGGASNPGVYCNASVSGIAETNEIVAGEPARGITWGTGGTPASGDYITCIWGAGINDPAAVTRWSDFISATNYKPFTLSQVMRVPTITNTIQRVGFWGTSVGASVTVDFVGLLLNTGVDSNWRCVVCTGGLCTPSGTTVAASTGVISVTVKSATTGTAECTIGATSMPVTTTLPTFASGVNPGFHTQTLTSASRSQTVFEAKLKVNR